MGPPFCGKERPILPFLEGEIKIYYRDFPSGDISCPRISLSPEPPPATEGRKEAISWLYSKARTCLRHRSAISAEVASSTASS